MDQNKDLSQSKPFSFFDTEDYLPTFWKQRELSDFATYSTVIEYEFVTRNKKAFLEWESCYLAIKGNFLIYCRSKKANQTVSYLDLNAYMYKLSMKQLQSKKYKHSFTISSHGRSADFYSRDYTQFLTFWNILKNFCILSDYKEHYNILETLGAGGYGQVYLVEDKFSKLKYAAKMIKVFPHRNVEKQKVMLINEVKILKKLSQQHIIKLYEVYENENEVCLVMEYVNGKRLFDHVVRSGKLSERETAVIIKQLFLTLSYLESETIIHRDIKPENILFTLDSFNKMTLKLIDFGLATEHLKRDIIKKCGTAGYTAPEILLNEQYDFKADLYSAGIVMYICLTGRPAFVGDEYKELLEDNRKGVIPYKEKHWSHISPEAKDLVQRILVPNPHQRISLGKALAHRWFEKMLPPEEMKDISEFNYRMGNMVVGEEDHISNVPVIMPQVSRLSISSRSRSGSIGSISQSFVTSKLGIGASPKLSPYVHSFYKGKTRDELEVDSQYTLNSPHVKTSMFSRNLSIMSNNGNKRNSFQKREALEIFDSKATSSPQRLSIALPVAKPKEAKDLKGTRMRLQLLVGGNPIPVKKEVPVHHNYTYDEPGGECSTISAADDEGSPVTEKYQNLKNRDFCFKQLFGRKGEKSKTDSYLGPQNTKNMTTNYSILIKAESKLLF